MSFEEEKLIGYRVVLKILIADAEKTLGMADSLPITLPLAQALGACDGRLVEQRAMTTTTEARR